MASFCPLVCIVFSLFSLVLGAPTPQLNPDGVSRQDFQDIFNEADEDGNGELSNANMNVLIKNQLAAAGQANLVTDQQIGLIVDAFMAVADTNEDGSLDFDEYIKVMMKGSDQKETVFNSFDTNGDGKLSSTELIAGSSPCSQMHGKIRDIGASITFSKCSLSDDHFVDHTCSTLENLTAINCKRSKWEPKKIDGKEISEGDSWKCPGQREKCTRFNDLISCEAGYCKNVSMVYDCTFTDSLASLQEKYGTKGQIDGWCNCNRCTESNGSANFFVYGQLTCPKATEYCFLPPKQFEEMRMLGRIKQEKLDELCKGPVYCQTCLDICIGQNDCLNIKSRRDVIKFGVDDKIEPEPLLTYYDCKEGNCTKVTNLVCNRTCDDKRFDMKNSKIILLQGERVVMADCENAAINDTEELPAAARVNPKLWNKMMMSCSSVTIYPDEGTRSFIKAEDCINGTWMEDLNPEVNGTVDYNTLTRKYFQVRSDPDRWIKRRQDDRYNLVPWEEDITIYNYTRLLKNQDMCVNTLAMECMDFYHRFGRDGSNYTSRAVFNCYYDPSISDYVVIDYAPERSLFFLIVWSIIPGMIVIVSCIYMCICSKFTITGDDGHMRIFCCGKAVTGIGNVVVYKKPTKSNS